jgi:HK97 family phage prohead protease
MKRYKSLDYEVKDVDGKQGLVKFYFSAFGNYDSDNDRIFQGAFNKSFTERLKRIKHFKWHDSRYVPGVIKELGEEGGHAYAVSQLSKSTLGRDTLIEYEEGIITEHSHGFEPVDGKYEKNEKGGLDFKEVKLWEVSSLTAWGANPNTPTVDVKEMDAETIIKMIDRMTNALKQGEFTDEYLKQTEIKLSELLKSLNEMLEPVEETTPQIKEPTIEELIKIYKLEIDK